MSNLSKNERIDKASKLFLSGYNCAQSVVLTFDDLIDMPRTTLANLSSSFGGGMGCLREVCGACSGMFMIAGLLCGYSSPDDSQAKQEHYARIQDLAGTFKAKHNTIICRELLKDLDELKSVPQKRTPQYYKQRPCVRFVESAVEIICDKILHC